MGRILHSKLRSVVLIICALTLEFPVADSFNVGVRSTACSLDQSNYNDPCKSLYEAECDGAHCKCPSGTHEDKGLKRCVRGPARGGGGGDFDDLPFDYVPGQKPQPKPQPKPSTPAPPVRPPPPQRPPNVPAQPQQPVEDPHLGEKAGGGIGGGLGLLIVAGLFYFCCCRGEKGQNLRSKLPFFKGSGGGGQPAANYQMQQQQPGQYPNPPQPAGPPLYPQQPYYPQPAPQPQPNMPPTAPPPY